MILMHPRIQAKPYLLKNFKLNPLAQIKLKQLIHIYGLKKTHQRLNLDK